jgi:hypothetical protein
VSADRVRALEDARRVNPLGPAGELGAPWYVQFWPLFIVFLMAVSIAASLTTVVIAYRHADVDVRQGVSSPPDEPGR